MVNGPNTPQPEQGASNLTGLVAEITQLPDVHILAEPHIAQAVGSTLTGFEYLVRPEIFDRAQLMQRLQELREQGSLPAEIESPEKFARRYRALVRDLPGVLAHKVAEGVPADTLVALEDQTAPILAGVLLASRSLRSERAAGVQLEPLGPDAYLARTLGGTAWELPRRSGLAVEFVAGLSGGLRRLREIKSGPLDRAVMLEGSSFPLRVVGQMATRLGVDMSHLEGYNEGMGGDAALVAMRMHRGELPAADLVIAARIRSAAAQEVRAALGLACDLGSTLIISDYQPEPGQVDVRDMISWASARFGGPDDVRTTVDRDGRAMHDAIFRR